MKTNCLIVDDESLAVKVLEMHIANIPCLDVIATCHNALHAMDILSRERIDLMFLDIHMPKLMGHEFLRTLRMPPKVIFTTAYREYALDAFDLDAADYLLKPVTLERLVKSINKVNNTKIPELEEGSGIVDNEGFVYFRSERKMVKMKYSEVAYFESMKDYIKIVRINNKPLLVKHSISSLEELLPVNMFLRVHRSYIVALDKISAFTSHAVEIAGVEIPVGRLYVHQLADITKSPRS